MNICEKCIHKDVCSVTEESKKKRLKCADYSGSCRYCYYWRGNRVSGLNECIKLDNFSVGDFFCQGFVDRERRVKEMRESAKQNKEIKRRRELERRAEERRKKSEKDNNKG